MKGNNLSYEDPFDSAPDENVVEQPAVPEPTVVVKSTAVADGEGKIVSTYKEGAGFDSSWTVVHAASVDDWFAIHEHPRFKELLDRQKKIGSYFRGGAAPSAGGDRRGSSPGAPPTAAQEAPGGEKRFCEHGEMMFKSGVSKAGNSYKLFSCTAPRDQQCKAQYLK